MIGLYVARESLLHRLSASLKLLTLFVFGVLVFLIRDWAVLLALLAGTLGLYAAARLGGHLLWAQLRPALALLLFFFVLQALTQGWQAGLVTVLRFGVMILLASLVTLTTRVSDLLAALERAIQPLAALGLNPTKVSLAISLTIRFIPVVGQVIQEVREAQQARGTEKNMVALAVPVVVRTLKMADDVADAIDARSFD